MNTKKKNTPTIPLDKILEEFKSMQKTLEELRKGNDPYKRQKKETGGLARTVNAGLHAGLEYMRDVNPINNIDKKIYSPKIPLNSEILRNYRQRFQDGGSTDLETDEGMTRYIVSILEGSQGLSPFEMKVLEESLQELKEKYGK